MNDGAIVQLFWNRDETAVEETKKKYEGYCHSIAQNILFNAQDSEECLNDVLLAAWHSCFRSSSSKCDSTDLQVSVPEP